MDHELASLLGRWHQWRQRFNAERGYSRPRLFSAAGAFDDEDFEQLMMTAVEDAVLALPRELQLAIQHVARAECLGVEVLTVRALLNTDRRHTLVAQAVEALRRRLDAAGVL